MRDGDVGGVSISPDSARRPQAYKPVLFVFLQDSCVDGFHILLDGFELASAVVDRPLGCLDRVRGFHYLLRMAGL